MDTPWLWFVSRSTGVVTVTLFTAVMVLGMATAARAGSGQGRRLSRAAVLRLHRQMSLVALVFLVVHIATAILDGYVDINVLDVVVPFQAGYAPVWIGLGTVAVDLLIAVWVSSLLRTRLPARLWKGIHWAAYGMWPLAVLHGLLNPGGDGSARWMQVVLAANVLAVLATAVLLRLRRSEHPDTAARRAGDHRHPARSAP